MHGNQLKNQHLWWRAGFGPPADRVHELAQRDPKDLFEELLKASLVKPEYFDVADPHLKEMVDSLQRNGKVRMQGLTPEERQMIRKQSVQGIYKLNVRWLQEMTDSPAQIREKMSLFWHGHFASKTVNILYDQEMLQVIRENALGNFRQLLLDVSQSASMIRFLNNDQNKVGHPNENFARELMELFTLGRGHYTETDVKESARAFTGWGTNPRGEYAFHPRLHDGGQKTFFGKTGDFSGEDIIHILLDQKQTARFITGKIYRFFVNDNPDEEKVNLLAQRFYESGYDIQDLLVAIFSSSWFYDLKNIGTQIKSPVLWMVGMRRQLPMELQNPAVQLMVERLLGQVLFAPPNVAGWPGGKHWIDSSSLMMRMQLPAIIEQSDLILTQPKEDDDLMMGMQETELPRNPKRMRNPAPAMFRTRILWDQYLRNFDSVVNADLYASIRDLLLQKTMPMNEHALIKYSNESSREARIKFYTIRLMGTPEYQLC